MPITLSLPGSPSGISARLHRGEFDRFLLIVPTKRLIRHLVREIVHTQPSAVSELPVFTMETLALRFLHVAFTQCRIVDEAVQSILIQQSLLKARDQLQYFRVRRRSPALPPGTFDKMLNVVRTLKETGITPAALEEEMGGAERDEHPKLKDIVTLYRTYDELLRAIDGVDREGLFQFLVHECSEQRFRELFHHLFPAVEEISIVGFDEFTEPELAFIQRLCTLHIPLTLEFDFQHGNSALFGHLEQNYQRFRALGFQETEPPPIASLDFLRHGKIQQPAVSTALNRSQTIAHLAKHLFRREASAPPLDCTASITLVKAANRLHEVRFICSLIKELMANHPDRDLSRICVAMAKPQLYTEMFREQFTKFGIPANITDRFELSQSPVVAAIVGLLDMVVNGFLRDDVVRTISSAYFDFRSHGESIDAANLINASREARIIGGLQAWLNRLEAHIQQLNEECAAGGNDRDTHRRRRSLQNFERARRDVRVLHQFVAELGDEQTPHEFRERVQQLLERLDLPRRIVSIERSHSPHLVEKDARAYAYFIDILERTMHLLEFQEGKDRTHSLRTYVDLLKVALLEERYNVREQPGQGVLVTSIEETRGLPIDVMIVAGLVDGEFPSVYESEVFFSARRLREREQRHRWENRYLFYQAITNWTEHLYLTYPEQDHDLDLVRSTFVDALTATAVVEQWEYPDRSPLAGTVYAEEDLLRAYGTAIGAGSDVAWEIPPSLQVKASYVRHAIAVDRSRTEIHNLPEYEGIIFSTLPIEARSYIEKQRDEVFSVRQLESYAKCPFQFFADRLLRISPLTEVEEELSPLERGSILHEVLFEFFTERREQNLPPITGCSDQQFAEAYRRLVELTRRTLESYDIPGAFWELEKEMILGDTAAERGLLYSFLQYERNRPSTLQPRYFEVGFGSQLGEHTRTDAQLSQQDPICAGNVLLRGKIDRVDMDDQAFAVLDYKTGRGVAKLKDIRRGISLQLPLYLYTIQHLLRDTHTPVAGAYMVLKRPVSIEIGIGSRQAVEAFGLARKNSSLVESNDELQQIINATITRVNEYVEGIAAGRFPLTNSELIDDVCPPCTFKTLCRIQTIRTVVPSTSEGV